MWSSQWPQFAIMSPFTHTKKGTLNIADTDKNNSFVDLSLFKRASECYWWISTEKHTVQTDTKNWFMGTIYTFQCRANTEGLSFSQWEGKQHYLSLQRTDSSHRPNEQNPFLCDQQNTLHNPVLDAVWHLALKLFKLWLKYLHRYENVNC